MVTRHAYPATPNLDSTPPMGTRLWGRSRDTGSTVKCQFNAMTRATSLAKQDQVPQHDQASGGQESYLLLGCILSLPKARGKNERYDVLSDFLIKK